MNSKNERRVMKVVFLTIFIDLAGFSIIFPLFPDMLGHYLGIEEGRGLLSHILDALHRISGTQAVGGRPSLEVTALFGGLLGSLYAVVQFIFAPMWGRLSDRIGRRRVLLLTITGMALSYLLWFFSGTFIVLVLSRLLGGVMSGNISVASAAVADVTPVERRAGAMGVVGAAIGVGFIFGPAIGGMASFIDLGAMHPGMQALGVNPFSAAAAVAFLLSIVNLLWVRRSFAETLAVGADSDSKRPRRGGRFAWLNERSIPGLRTACWLNFFFLTAFSGMEFTLTFLALDRFDYTPRMMVWIFLYVGGLVAVIQGGVVRRLAPRFGENRLVIIGMLMAAPGLLFIGQSKSQPLFYAGLALMAVGAALTMPSVRSLGSRYATADRQGEALGLIASAGALARATGPILAGLAYWRLGSQLVYAIGAASIVVPLILALLLPAPAAARK